MARAIILASFFAQCLYAGRILKKNKEDGSQAAVHSAVLVPTALLPTVTVAHVGELTWVQPSSSLHGGVGRRAPSVSMQILPGLPKDWRKQSSRSLAVERLNGQTEGRADTAVLPQPVPSEQSRDNWFSGFQGRKSASEGAGQYDERGSASSAVNRLVNMGRQETGKMPVPLVGEMRQSKGVMPETIPDERKLPSFPFFAAKPSSRSVAVERLKPLTRATNPEE